MTTTIARPVAGYALAWKLQLTRIINSAANSLFACRLVNPALARVHVG